MTGKKFVKRLLDPPEYDNRSFKEQMNDIGVEVRPTSELNWCITREQAERMIFEANAKGLIKPEKIMEIPKEKVENMLIERGLNSRQAADELGMGVATFNILRRVYGLQARDIKAKTSKGKQQKVEPELAVDNNHGKEASKPEKEEEHIYLDINVKNPIPASAAAGLMKGLAVTLERMGDVNVNVTVEVSKNGKAKD